MSSLFLVALPAAVAFAALYAGVLFATYLYPSGILAGAVGAASLIALAIAGGVERGGALGAKAFALALLPKVVGLYHQSMRLGSGGGLSAFPIVSTLAYTLALVLVVQVVARRSER